VRMPVSLEFDTTHQYTDAKDTGSGWLRWEPMNDNDASHPFSAVRRKAIPDLALVVKTPDKKRRDVACSLSNGYDLDRLARPDAIDDQIGADRPEPDSP